jgi:hypothetical protein
MELGLEHIRILTTVFVNNRPAVREWVEMQGQLSSRSAIGLMINGGQNLSASRSDVLLCTGQKRQYNLLMSNR